MGCKVVVFIRISGWQINTTSEATLFKLNQVLHGSLLVLMYECTFYK